ncbi:hypothetical protein DFP72DRAFT_898288 [Ephemerocybe angulata]|uniref:Uncharacterized protein n=1 Tax=Ephemerocybe angulata TaxID=980116 RepID=A0A8H6M6S1_9AGAR|nr:hypothetical protein DFP72DRAFT_898288 [Tulosesus angulatus]
MVGEPSLWTTIVITPDSPFSSLRLVDSPLASYLLRSNGRPLSVYFLPGSREQATAALLADVIEKDGHRIQALVVCTRWKSSLLRVGCIMDPQRLPKLHRLVIKSTIDDVGPPDITLPATFHDTLSTLFALSINAVNLFDFLTSTEHPQDILGLLTSLKITDLRPGAAGFLEDGLSMIIGFIDSLLYLAVLEFDDFQMAERHLGIYGRVPPRASAPTQVQTLKVKSTSPSGRSFLLHHVSPMSEKSVHPCERRN